MLDDIEIQIIQYLKQRMATGEPPLVRDLKAILATVYTEEEVTTEIVAKDLAAIVEEYALAPLPEVIATLSPDQHWKYGLPAEGDSDVERYWGNWVRALGSVLSLCDITSLPGYEPAPV